MNRGDRVLTPTRLLNEIKQNKVSTVVVGMHVYKGMEIFTVNMEWIYISIKPVQDSFPVSALLLLSRLSMFLNIIRNAGCEEVK